MIEYLKYKWSLQKLRKAQLKISKELEQVNARAQTQDNYAEASSLNQDEEEITSWIEHLQTKYYYNICQNLLIPIPNRDDKNLYYQYNFDDDEGERYILTSMGFHHVRKLIREERKERREAVGYWATIIIGIIGALTGLASIIKSN